MKVAGFGHPAKPFHIRTITLLCLIRCSGSETRTSGSFDSPLAAISNPRRYIRRYLNGWLALIPHASAICATEVPGRSMDLPPFLTQKVKVQNSSNGEFELWGYREGNSRESSNSRAAAIGSGASIAAVARACEINPNLLHRWRKDFQHSAEHAFPGLGNRHADDSRVAELERKIGQQAFEIDFLKRCLQRIEERRMLQALSGKPAIEQMCRLAGVSRKGFYRFDPKRVREDHDMDLRDALQHRLGNAELWPVADHGETETPRLDSESQARAAHYARR